MAFFPFKNEFLYKNESSSDSLHRTQLGLGARAAFLQLCQGTSSLPFLFHFFEDLFYPNIGFVFNLRRKCSRIQAGNSAFSTFGKQGNISDSQLCPLKALGREASRRKAEAQLPGVPQQLLQSFFKVVFARKCTLNVSVHKQVLPAQALTPPTPKKSIILKNVNPVIPSGLYNFAPSAKLRQLWSCWSWQMPPGPPVQRPWTPFPWPGKTGIQSETS